MRVAGSAKRIRPAATTPPAGGLHAVGMRRAAIRSQRPHPRRTRRAIPGPFTRAPQANLLAWSGQLASRPWLPPRRHALRWRPPCMRTCRMPISRGWVPMSRRRFSNWARMPKKRHGRLMPRPNPATPTLSGKRTESLRKLTIISACRSGTGISIGCPPWPPRIARHRRTGFRRFPHPARHDCGGISPVRPES